MVLPRIGGPDVFEKSEDDMPARPEDHIRVQVTAAGINWADVQQRLGLYPEAPPRPYAPGYEVAGEVLEAPDGSDYAPGDRIVSATKFGGYTSIMDVDPRGAARIPDALSDDEAAAVPVVWLTAHEALHERARVREGESVLVHGGAGGVGLAAIALARQAGCTVLATAGGPRKKEYLETEAGVDIAIDHQAGDWRQQVLDRHGPVDHILDPLGGDHLRQSLKTLAPGGRVVAYGASGTAAKGRRSLIQALKVIRKMRFSAIGFMFHNTGIVGLNMLTAMQAEPERLRRTMESIMQDMADGSLPRPVIARSFPLEKVADAHRFLQSRQSIGKVILNP